MEFTDEQRNNIKEYLEENADVLNNLVEEINSENGDFEDDIFYPMYDLDELLSNQTPTEILFCASCGYDNDTSTDNSHEPFDATRDYFKFNGYGNPVSYSDIDYSDLIDDVINELENGVVDLPDEIEDMIDSDEDEEE